jgi:NAD-dependent dihydropyrimidine dehydrogenase PreA subunit
MLNAYLENTLTFTPERCNGCRMCLMVCPHAVFEPDGKVVKPAHPYRCMECGACRKNCPTGALTVNSGVGCATAMFMAALKGKDEAECGCGGPVTVDNSSCC